MESHAPAKLFAVVDEVQTRSRSAGTTYQSSLYLGDVKLSGTDINAELALIKTQLAALQANAVTSAEIRTISKVSTMPANPVASTLYVIAGNGS
jgi:hypothetical protein